MSENEIPTKRICESEWHEEIQLEQFEKCPICGSETYHRLLKFIGDGWV